MNQHPSVLFIVEQGGYPIFADELQREGLHVQTAMSMRKALALLKSGRPDVIIAEFNYGTQFRDRISNLEPLLARVQTDHREARVIVLLDRDHQPHLDRLASRFPIFDVIYFPVESQHLQASIRRAADARRSAESAASS